MEQPIKYDAKAFIEALKSRMVSRPMPRCPFCGCNVYTTPKEAATIPAGMDIKGLSVGRTAPCAMVVCTKCGHVDYFALGTLGLLPHGDEEKKGGTNEH